MKNRKSMLALMMLLVGIAIASSSSFASRNVDRQQAMEHFQTAV